MAQHIRVGTQVYCGGAPLDVYIVERITRTGEHLTLEVRTKRQRCFDRALTGYTTWTATYMQEQVRLGKMQVLA